MLANSLVSSKLDFCNSLHSDLPKSSLQQLQLVQNALARAIYPGSRKRDHVSPLLRRLHWLPIEQRIRFKIATLTFKTLQLKSPSYLCDLLVPKVTTRNLRSSDKRLLVVPRVDSSLGRRSFAFFAPTLWNSLMEVDHLRECFVNDDIVSFRSKLKTHLFPPWTCHLVIQYLIFTDFDLCCPFSPSWLFDLLTGQVNLSWASLKLRSRGETDVKRVM